MDLDPMETTCLDSNPNRSISPMECESDTDLQTGQGSWVLVNETKEDMDRTESSNRSNFRTDDPSANNQFGLIDPECERSSNRNANPRPEPKEPHQWTQDTTEPIQYQQHYGNQGGTDARYSKQPNSVQHGNQGGTDARYSEQSDSVQHGNQGGTDARYSEQSDSVQHGNQGGTDARYSEQSDSVQHGNQDGTDDMYSKHPDPVQHGNQGGADARYSKEPGPVQHGNQGGTDGRYSKEPGPVQHENQGGTDARNSKEPDPVQHGNQGGTDVMYSKHPDPVQHGNQGGTDASYSRHPDQVQYGNQGGTDARYSKEPGPVQHGNQGGIDARHSKEPDSVPYGNQRDTGVMYSKHPDPVQHGNQGGIDARYSKEPGPVQYGNQRGTDVMYSKHPDPVQHGNQGGIDARYSKEPGPVQHGNQGGIDARYSKEPDSVSYGNQRGTDVMYSKHPDPVQHGNQGGIDARYSKEPGPVQYGNQRGTDVMYSKHPDPVQHGNQGGIDARYSKEPGPVQYGNQRGTDVMYSRQTDSIQHGNDRNSRVYPDSIHNAPFNNSQGIRNGSPMGQMHIMKEAAPHQQSIYINQSYTRIPNPNMACWPFKVNDVHPPYPTHDPLKITVVRHQPTENHSNHMLNQMSDFPKHRLFSPNDNDNSPLNSQQSNDVLNSQRQQHLYTRSIQHVEHQNVQGGPGGFQCRPHSSEGFRQQVDYPQNSHGGTVNPNYQLAQTSTMYHDQLNGDKLSRIHEGQSLSHTTFNSSHINPKENIPKVQPIATNLKRDTNDTTVTYNMTENYPQKIERTLDHPCQFQGRPAYGDEKNTDITRNRPDGNGGLEKKRDTYDTTITHNMTENYPQKIERTIDHPCQVQERPAYGDEKNTDITRNRPDGNGGLETEESPVNPITTDQTRSVLVELKDQQSLGYYEIKFALKNKKKGGGPIEKLIYSSVKNQYLVIFEDSNDARKIVNKNFQVSDVPLKLSLYWEDPENFDKQQKPKPLKIKIKSFDICRVKFIVQNIKLLQDFQRRLRVKCEYKSMVKDSGEYLMTFDLLEYIDDLESKSADAADILMSIADDLVQDVVEVSNGINLKLQVKELDKETKDVILTCSGQKVYIVSRSREMVKKYKQKIDTMIKEHHDEMKRKNEKLEKINLEPVEKQFFQRYLLESEKLKHNNVMLTLDETGVTVKGQCEDCNDSVQFIYDKLSKVPCQNIFDVNSLEHLFLKEYIQVIESRLNEKNLKVCIGMKKDQLVILSSDKHDGIQAENIVKDSFTSESLSVETTQFLGSREWQSLVSAIKEKHGTKVMIETDSKANKMKIVGVPNIVREVSNEIEEYLDSITEVTDNVSADVTKMDYIRRYEYGKILAIQNKCNLAIDCDSLPWKLNGTKKSVEKGKSSVISFIDDIKADTVVMKFIGIVSLFTQPRGKEIISSIGEETNCLIIEENKIPSGSTDEVPLRQWKLPNGKKIEVLKTDMRYLRCDAIVNAANSHLRHGAGLAGAIVEMGGYEIQKECDRYVSSKGEVKVGEVMVGSSGHLPCKKIIHAVGPVWHNGTRNEAALLDNAIFQSLKAADKCNFSSIAIPAISTGIFRYPMADACKIIVETIVKYLVKSNGTVTHVLLCDIKEDSLTAFIKSLSFELGEKNGSDRKESDRDENLGAVGGVSYPDHSNTDETSDAEDNDNISASDSGDSVDDNSGESDNDSVKSTMKVKSGEITKQQVDVIVNCTSEKLNLKSGAVSRAILEAAGSSIQSECDKRSGGISPGDIAVTSGGKLSCTKIYHTCIQSYTTDKSQARKTLEESIQKILVTATKSGFKSIAIPALGCGRLGFPADVSAKIVFETTKKFFTSTPETSLKEINFVVHPKDTSVLKAYSEIGKEFDVLVVTTPSYSKHRQTNRNEKLSFGKLTIEICQGDLTKESTDCIVNVCTQSMELKYGISKLISEKGGSDIAKECSQRKSEMKKDGILITESGKLRCSAICHLLIPKSSHDWTDIIKKALYKMNKEEFKSVSLPAIGTGGLKVNPKESAEFIMSALKSYGEKVKHPKLTKARVVIYQKEHVSEFLKVFNVDGHKRYHDAPSHRGREHRQTNQKPIRRDMNEIKLTIYSDSLTNIEHAKQKLDDRFRGEMLTKKIPQYLRDMIEKLDSRQMAKLKDIAESFYVKLKYDKSSKEISLDGLTKQVTDCCDQIVDRLQNWKSSEQKNSEKAILSKYVDWVYEEKSGGRTHSFGPGISAMLEKAKMNKDTEIEITDHRGRKYTVNLKEMKEYPRHGSPVKIHRVEKGVVKGSKLLKGEKEALSGDTTKYFTLLPERNYDASKAEEYHFRLAESQFSRLLNNSGHYSVTQVEYVVNPVLNKKFRAAQKELKDNIGEENSLPVLAFHGTDVNNIKLICENGFKKQGDSGFSQSHGAKYGQGVYFSEYPDYSMRYIHGSTKLLLCQVLIGKSYTCTGLRGSNGQVEPGYDSHISSDKKELVIFKTERILPCYIVHYVSKSGDYQYK